MSPCPSCGSTAYKKRIFCPVCGTAVHPGPASLSGNKRLYVRSDETLLAEFNQVRVRQILRCRVTWLERGAGSLEWTAPTVLLTDRRIVFLNQRDSLEHYILGVGPGLSSMFSFWIYDFSLGETLGQEYLIWQGRMRDLCREEWEKSKLAFQIKLITGNLKAEPAAAAPMVNDMPPMSWMEVRSVNIEKKAWGGRYLHFQIDMAFAETKFKASAGGPVVGPYSRAEKNLSQYTAELASTAGDHCGQLFIEERWLNQVYPVIAAKLGSACEKSGR